MFISTKKYKIRKKTRIMANIQTPIRLIKVKETYEEVCKAMNFNLNTNSAMHYTTCCV